MTTSEGWVRANLVYDTLKEPPAPGSPLEAVCAFVFISRQRAKYLETKAIVQASITESTKESSQSVMEDLHEEMFPDQKQEKLCQKKNAVQILEKHSAPIVVSKM